MVNLIKHRLVFTLVITLALYNTGFGLVQTTVNGNYDRTFNGTAVALGTAANPASARSTQSHQLPTDHSLELGAEPISADYVLQEVNGDVLCRDATLEESVILRARDELIPLQVISPQRTSVVGPQEAGLQIVLRGTPQLENFPQARDAFLRAAETWENLIQSAITVIIDVDFGPTRFGQPYPSPNILGSTSPQKIGASSIYPTVRSSLIAQASGQREAELYNALPASSVNTDIGGSAGMFAPSALFRALGIINAAANPATETATLGPPPAMGFNSAFDFDFDPGNGIDPDKTDFDAVAVHELGHALGFSSNVGSLELNPTSALTLGMLDLFRVRPGISLATFPTATRIQSSGNSHVFFAGTSELELSTGRPDGSGGDGRQASHWKDDGLTGRYLGIMDPIINRGTRYTITNNDLSAFDSFGYQLRGGGGGGDTVPLTSGVSQPGSISSPNPGAARVSSTQYSVQVPNGATELRVDLSGDQDVDLFVRFGQRVAPDASGRPIADFASESPTGGESITVTPSSEPRLNAGTYYVAIANYGPGATRFILTATVTRGADNNDAPRIATLQAELSGDELILTGTAFDADGDITQAQSDLLNSAGQKVGETEPFPVNFGGLTTVNFRLKVTNLSSLPTAMLASVVFIDSRGNRSDAATADFSGADPGGSTLIGATYGGNKLVIKGAGFSAQLLIEINGQVIGIFPSATDRKAKVKGATSRLNLRTGPNRLRVYNGSFRSNLLVLIL